MQLSPDTLRQNRADGGSDTGIQMEGDTGSQDRAGEAGREQVERRMLDIKLKSKSVAPVKERKTCS